MNAKLKTTAAFLAGALLAVGGTALAGPGGPGGLGVTKMIWSLELNEDQQALADELKSSAKEDMRAGREAYKASKTATLEELAKATPDRDRLHALVDQQLDTMRASAHERLDDFLTLHASLSDEQRQELVQSIEAMSERRGERKGKRGMKHHRYGERGGPSQR